MAGTIDITKLNLKNLIDTLRYIISNINDILYTVCVEEPVALWSLIKHIFINKLHPLKMYEKLYAPLEGSVTKIFIKDGPTLLSVVDKVLIKDEWHYYIDGSFVRDYELMSKLYIINPVIQVSSNGKAISGVKNTNTDIREWVECTLKLNSSNKYIKVIIAKVIDRRLSNHLSKFVRSSNFSYNHMVYKPDKRINLMLSITSIFDLNRKLDKPITLNYDLLSMPLRSISDYRSKSNLSLILPLELLFNYIYFFRPWLISVLLTLMVTLSLFFLRDIPVNKYLFTIGSISLFSYLLLSGFVFFIKKYRYGKYTTAMHRFWRRSFSIFWALEGFLFIVFMYLTILSNQEPFFMYDNIQFFKTYTYSWRLFLSENLLVLLIISLLHYVVIRHKDVTSYKLNVYVYLTSLIFFALTYVEFYQFFYTISHYNPTVWVFDYEANKWVLDYESTQSKRTRILLHFVTICLIAKFWHFVFILLFWVFTVSKLIQLGNLSYQLLGANLQNSIILYLLNWILMYPWLKVAFRKFMYRHYKWLYVNFRSIGLRVALNDLFIYYSIIVDSIWLYVIELKLSWMFLYYSIVGSDLLRSDFFTPLV